VKNREECYGLVSVANYSSYASPLLAGDPVTLNIANTSRTIPIFLTLGTKSTDDVPILTTLPKIYRVYAGEENQIHKVTNEHPFFRWGEVTTYVPEVHP